jgi:hypothetical protein
VEAVISDSSETIYRPNPDIQKILGLIDKVFTYNNSLPDSSERFDGIHLDVEPWVHSGGDLAWVDPLIATYQTVQPIVLGAGLTLAADMGGVQIVNAGVSTEQRQALLEGATRLVLMEYGGDPPGIAENTVISRVTRFRDSVDWSDPSLSFMIATRVEDFPGPGQNIDLLNRLEGQFNGQPGYGGWATFTYADYLNGLGGGGSGAGAASSMVTTGTVPGTDTSTFAGTVSASAFPVSSFGDVSAGADTDTSHLGQGITGASNRDQALYFNATPLRIPPVAQDMVADLAHQITKKSSDSWEDGNGASRFVL